jgi:RimJ/RimL family protein N-acetyltransferase
LPESAGFADRARVATRPATLVFMGDPGPSRGSRRRSSALSGSVRSPVELRAPRWPALVTPRLRLIPATTDLVDAELRSAQALGDALGARLADDWPPEHHTEAMLRRTRAALERPGAAGWWLHWIAWTADGRPVLVGTCGFKGPPTSPPTPPAGGTVEIGYSVVPSWRRRGIATEAARALADAARARGAGRVIAHTLPHLEPSIGVLRRLGFEPGPPPEPGVLAFVLPLPAAEAGPRG